jgi:hypothetical protein
MGCFDSDDDDDDDDDDDNDDEDNNYDNNDDDGDDDVEIIITIIFLQETCMFCCCCCRVSQPVSRSPSDAESSVDSAPPSLDSTKNGLSKDGQFGIRRLMEDLGIFI